MHRICIFILVKISIVFSFPARSIEAPRIHGFASIVAASADTDFSLPWVGNEGRQPDAENFSRLGINLTAAFESHLNFAAQIVARGGGAIGGQPSFIMSADWLFFTYRPNNEWMVRVGRQLYPLFLFSEQVDVGFTYLWTRLPTVVYGIAPVKSFNGTLVSYSYFLGSMEASIAAYAGSMSSQIVSPGIGGYEVEDRDTQGTYVSVNGEGFKLLASYKRSWPTIRIYAPSSTGSQLSNSYDLKRNHIFSLGGTGEWKKLFATGEFARTYSTSGGNYDHTGFYGTLGWGFDEKKVVPHLTYGKRWSNTNLVTHPDPTTVFTHGSGANQRLITQQIAGIRYRLASKVVLKVEYEKNALVYQNSNLNFDANIFSMSLDAVF